MYRDPVAFFTRCREQLGPIFRIGYPGSAPFAFVAEPALARELFALGDDVARAGEAREPFLAPIVGEQSLLCVEGDAWRRQRELIAPPLHRERVATWQDAIAEIARTEIDRWPTDGAPIAVHGPMQRITLEVILRVVFGVADDRRLDRLRTLVARLMGSAPVALLIPQLAAWLQRPLVRSLPGNPLRGFTALRKAIDDILYAEIAECRSAEIGHRTDLLAALVGARDEHGDAMTDQEIRDELVTMLVAGHETTATALAWSFERLARHPTVQHRLAEDLDAGNTRYLDAVIKETLRSRPVVFDTPRALARDVELGRHRIPAGWLLAAAIPLVHRDPELFADPDRYKPERFLDDRGPINGWIPFGGGKRRCVGSRLALLELQTVLTVAISHLTIRTQDHRPERQRVRIVTLIPHRGATVTLQPR